MHLGGISIALRLWHPLHNEAGMRFREAGKLTYSKDEQYSNIEPARLQPLGIVAFPFRFGHSANALSPMFVIEFGNLIDWRLRQDLKAL